MAFSHLIADLSIFFFLHDAHDFFRLAHNDDAHVANTKIVFFSFFELENIVGVS